MEARPFRDRARPPTAAALARALGRSRAGYDQLATLTAALAREWTYAPASGWMLKIHDGAKALCYLIPLAGAFRVSLAVRVRERAPLLADPSLAALHDALAAAKEHREGLALRLDVRDRASYAPVAALLARLIALRAT